LFIIGDHHESDERVKKRKKMCKSKSSKKIRAGKKKNHSPQGVRKKISQQNEITSLITFFSGRLPIEKFLLFQQTSKFASLIVKDQKYLMEMNC